MATTSRIAPVSKEIKDAAIRPQSGAERDARIVLAQGRLDLNFRAAVLSRQVREGR